VTVEVGTMVPILIPLLSVSPASVLEAEGTGTSEYDDETGESPATELA